MAEQVGHPEPPYDVQGVPERFRDTPWDELPPGLRQRISSKLSSSAAADESGQ